MAGGTFLAQNKIRAGAYINFVAVPAPSTSIGTRGVAALPLIMDWGPDYVELLSTDLVDGKSLPKVGLTASDAASLPMRLALSNAYKLLIARTNTDGTKASVTSDGLKLTARYAGVLGNKLSVIVKKIANTELFDVITALDGVQKDTQRVADISKLVSNDWVEFEAAVAGANALTETAAKALTGGSNGTESDDSYNAALSLLFTKSWNTLGVMSDETIRKSAATTLITNDRERQGKKRQCVLLNAGGAAGANYEGIITSKQGYIDADGQSISEELFVAYLTGLSAGSSIIQSNTYHVIKGAKIITGEPTSHEDIEEALKQGYTVLSYRSDGVVVIEKDINSLCDFPSTKSYAFSKNRIMRCLDEIGNTLALTWEKTYVGKVNNDATGRNLFKADMINYFHQLESLGAITNFDKDKDIEVLAGADIDAVICNYWVQPVDSMEKLYATVNVNG